MKAKFFVLSIIFLFPYFSFGLLDYSIFQSIVVLTDESSSLSMSSILAYKPINIMSYGIRLNEDKIILPINGDELYRNLKKIIFLKNYFFRNSFVVNTDFPEGSLTQLNDAAFIYKSFPLPGSADPDKYLKISRYPICNNEENLKTIHFSAQNISVIEYYPRSADTCEEYFWDFNRQQQTCSGKMKPTQAGIPLISSFDGFNYLVGLSDPLSNINSTLYNLIVEECYGFPGYDSCQYFSRTSPSKYTFCNSDAISRDLNNFKGIILFGNVQGYNTTSFIPFGLGTVLDDKHVILPSTVLNSLKNYKIIGNGNELKLAFMINKNVSVFNKNDYNVTNTGKKLLQLVKFKFDVFKNFSKAELLFEESQKSKDKIKSFQFNQKNLELNKWHKNDETVVKDNEKFLLGAPMFYNGATIGFQNQTSYISVFEIKSFLQKSLSNLTFKVSEITTAATTVTFTKTNILISTTNGKPRTSTTDFYGSSIFDTPSIPSSSDFTGLDLFLGGTFLVFNYALCKFLK